MSSEFDEQVRTALERLLAQGLAAVQSDAGPSSSSSAEGAQGRRGPEAPVSVREIAQA